MLACPAVDVGEVSHAPSDAAPGFGSGGAFDFGAQLRHEAEFST